MTIPAEEVLADGVVERAPSPNGERALPPMPSPNGRLAVPGTRSPNGERPVGGHAVPHAVFSDITRLLVSADSPDPVLEAVADALAELVPHDALRLFEAYPLLRVLRPVMVRDEASADAIDAMEALPYGKGIAGLAAETAKPQLFNDAHLDPRGHHLAGRLNGPESLLSVPLVARDDLKGVLVLSRLGQGNRFTNGDLELVIALSRLAALAIDHAQIRSRLEAEVVTDHLTALYDHRYFHERMAEELRRASRQRSRVSLIIYDIDDFKRVNDTYGHLMGDRVLQSVASLSREVCRMEDVVCRLGGEEFAIIIPGCPLSDALGLADRIRRGIGSLDFPAVGRISVSLGVAEGPLQASSPRELIACADLALREAKVAGKDQVRAYLAPVQPAEESLPGAGPGRPLLESRHRSRDRGNGESPPGQGLHARMAVLTARGEVRSIAQLRVLQSLSAKLNRLIDVREIGEVVTLELRTLIDYHNCRVFLVQPDGESLLPIAFRGEPMEYRGETFDALATRVGKGLAGHVAVTGRPHYAPNSNEDRYAESIPGTPDLDESILGVPLKYGDRVIGVIVLSKLGIDQFDDEDRRLLEALASAAAVAIENARLLQAERDSAQASAALLWLSRVLTGVTDKGEVLEQALKAIPSLIACSGVHAWIRDRDAGGFRLARLVGFGEDVQERLAGTVIPAEVAEPLIRSVVEPFVISREVAAGLPAMLRFNEEPHETLLAPMRWESDGLGGLGIVSPDPEASFGARDLELARGIADITSLALGNAQRYDDLEEAYLSTVEALAGALEAKDQYTEDHCRALAQMAVRVGAEMGISGDELRVLELGALFHDIGKIGIPTEIIRKPGPLTATERSMMNRHPDIGSDILAPVPFLQAVRPIVRASHERWDGKGYPEGVASEQIPLGSRIVFVCDAFHAMTSDRPYRRALPESEAIRRLRAASGTQFDPQVVEVFARLHAAGAIKPS